MRGTVHGGTDVGDMRCHTGRGFVVDYGHCLDGVGAVLPQPRLDHCWVDPVAPIARLELHPQLVALGELPPLGGKMTGFHHQHRVPRRQGIDQRCFPGTGPGGGVNDDRTLCLQDRLQSPQQLTGKGGEFRTPVVDGGGLDGAQNSRRHVRGPRNLKKMAPAAQTHLALFRCGIVILHLVYNFGAMSTGMSLVKSG